MADRERARLGVGVGGTFTDMVAISDGRAHVTKTPSTPATPECGVPAGVEPLRERGRIEHDDGETERLPGKSTRELSPGSVVSRRTPGTGSYGDPTDRDPSAIAHDLALGTVTAGAVEADYGLSPDELPEE